VTESNQRAANMQSAPAQQDGYFLVPRVIEWVGTIPQLP
jgi:aspartyl-tRNA(Asn)/glutamyl-tRNA(Gln) amidotransferase subunit C